MNLNPTLFLGYFSSIDDLIKNTPSPTVGNYGIIYYYQSFYPINENESIAINIEDLIVIYTENQIWQGVK